MHQFDDEELVSVVIPARNEREAIDAAVRSALGQTYRNLEVLVVDGDSQDGTAEVVAELASADPRVRLIRNPDRIIPIALNRAVREARGRYLVRLDAHATIPDDYVARAVKHLATGRWGGVGGRKDGVSRTRAGQAVAVAMGDRFGVGNSVYHYGTTRQVVDHVPFGAYPLDVVRELGGWNESLPVNEDYEFDYRVRRSGRELLFDPALTILWESRQSLRDLARQYHRYGKGKAKVVGLHPASLQPRHLAAPALVVGLAAAAAIVPRSPRAAAAMVLPYAAGVAVATVHSAPKLRSRSAVIYLPGAFVTMHLAWGTGFLRGVPTLVKVLFDRP